MSKYTRSRSKLVALIKEVFAACEISLDTKAIVLVLAGTLPSASFFMWINQIPQLEPLKSQFKEINAIRHELGPKSRDYIMLSAFWAVDREISSDELQKYISDSSPNSY